MLDLFKQAELLNCMGTPDSVVWGTEENTTEDFCGMLVIHKPAVLFLEPPLQRSYYSVSRDTTPACSAHRCWLCSP